jgi:hypothetical protein
MQQHFLLMRLQRNYSNVGILRTLAGVRGEKDSLAAWQDLRPPVRPLTIS